MNATARVQLWAGIAPHVEALFAATDAAAGMSSERDYLSEIEFQLDGAIDRGVSRSMKLRFHEVQVKRADADVLEAERLRLRPAGCADAKPVRNDANRIVGLLLSDYARAGDESWEQLFIDIASPMLLRCQPSALLGCLAGAEKDPRWDHDRTPAPPALCHYAVSDGRPCRLGPHHDGPHEPMDGPAYATLRAPRGSLGCAFGGMARAEEP
jgi:hypothetical protein